MPASSAPLLTVEQLTREENGLIVVDAVSFIQAKGERVAIAGATGSGKTTLLKMIAGLVQPTGGRVVFSGEQVLGPEEKLLPGHAAIAYLSQHFELRNHYRVKETIAMAAKLPEEQVQRICALCRIEPFLQRWTHQLSGGERQRVALARTLVAAPKLLLLDEPFSNLDPFHRATLKTVLSDVEQDLAISCALVSHEPADTLSWADRILVLSNGVLIQQGIPEEIYRYPATAYVAGLFGPYVMLQEPLLQQFGSGDSGSSKKKFHRPEDFILTDASTGVPAEVGRQRFNGSYYQVEVRVDNEVLLLNVDRPIKTTRVFVAMKA